MPKGSPNAPENASKTVTSRRRSANGESDPDVVRTRRLEVIDSAGRVRAVIGGPDALFGLTIHDEEGRERIFLTFRENGKDAALDFSNGEAIVASFGVVDEQLPTDRRPYHPGLAHLDLADDDGDVKTMLGVFGDGREEQINHWLANIDFDVRELRDFVLRLSKRVKAQFDYLSIMSDTMKVTGAREADELARDMATLEASADDNAKEK